ncbi:MAG: gliding motility lipoprotein GldH [Bacteroidetes bacterium]|nr:gliding motility lipoprotein GldH [Bacteroidota bacterium]
MTNFFPGKISAKLIGACMLIVMIASLSACDSRVVFEENVKLPENRWAQSNMIVLKADIQDTVTSHNLYINLRNAGGYQFSNLFLFFTTITPSGKKERDTLELTLADPSGKWLGDGMGDIWDNRQLFKKDFRFPETGQYTFQLEQAMRIDPLPQVMDCGIRIEKAN